MSAIPIPTSAVAVVTMDQRASRSAGDLVDARRERLNDRYRASLELPFVRTVGDEIQAAAREASWLVDLILDETRAAEWWIGVGIAAQDAPLGATARDSRGEAFYAARDAVQAAKERPWGFALRGDAEFQRVEDCLIAASWIVRRRTDRQHAAVVLLRETGRQTQVAEALGISPPSVNERLSGAGVDEEDAARRLAGALLAEAVRRAG